MDFHGWELVFFIILTTPERTSDMRQKVASLKNRKRDDVVSFCLSSQSPVVSVLSAK